MARIALSSLACVWTGGARFVTTRHLCRQARDGEGAPRERRGGRLTHGLVLLALGPQDTALAGNLFKLGLDKLEQVVEALSVGMGRSDDADDGTSGDARGGRWCSRGVHEAVERVRLSGGGGSSSGSSTRVTLGPTDGVAGGWVVGRVRAGGGAWRGGPGVEGDGAERAVVVHAARGH